MLFFDGKILLLFMLLRDVVHMEWRASLVRGILEAIRIHNRNDPMLPSQREKLLQTIVYFVRNTKHCHKLKLFKLLYLLDFEIYRQTGKSTTGLRYFAWPNGPVPNELFNEFKRPQPDMTATMAVVVADDFDRLDLTPRHPFNSSAFSRRELRTMERLAEVYRDAIGENMIDVTHVRGSPWHQVYVGEGNRQAPIPYSLALDDRPDSITKEQAEEIELEARERAALVK